MKFENKLPTFSTVINPCFLYATVLGLYPIKYNPNSVSLCKFSNILRLLWSFTIIVISLFTMYNHLLIVVSSFKNDSLSPAAKTSVVFIITLISSLLNIVWSSVRIRTISELISKCNENEFRLKKTRKFAKVFTTVSSISLFLWLVGYASVLYFAIKEFSIIDLYVFLDQNSSILSVIISLHISLTAPMLSSLMAVALGEHFEHISKSLRTNNDQSFMITRKSYFDAATLVTHVDKCFSTMTFVNIILALGAMVFSWFTVLSTINLLLHFDFSLIQIYIALFAFVIHVLVGFFLATIPSVYLFEKVIHLT